LSCLALLGPLLATTRTNEANLRAIKSDVDYGDRIVDHTRPPDPIEVRKLVGYILEGMSHAHRGDGHRPEHAKEPFLQRDNRRRKTKEP